MFVSSGTTAIATTADTAVEAIAAASAIGARNVRAVNEGTVAGFISFNGGGVWHRLPPGATGIPYVTDFQNVPVSGAIQVKRIASGSNLAGVYVSAWS